MSRIRHMMALICDGKYMRSQKQWRRTRRRSCHRGHEIRRRHAMTIRTSVLSGIAVLAIAGVPPALAQTTPQTAPDTAQTTAVSHRAIRHHHTRSGPQESTPAEKAETQKLNEEQLQADASPGPAMVPNSQPSDVQPGSEPTQPTPGSSMNTPQSSSENTAPATQKQPTPQPTSPPQP
jgi:hypothetical protein